MKIAFLLIVWIIVIFLCWFISVFTTITIPDEKNQTEKDRINKYGRRLKTLFYFIGVVCSFVVGYLITR